MSAVSDLIESEAYKNIETQIEGFICEKLKDYEPLDMDKKVIHDSVWGSVEYFDWEMQLIDSPLFQRLRDINQVGLALLTYPAARHSRFEHSLGVNAAAKKMCLKINSNSVDFSIPEETENCIYLTALLHDVGHCFYSHLSESIYGELEEFTNLIKEFNAHLDRTPKPHEILSFMIVNSKSFKDFFINKIAYPKIGCLKNTLFFDVGKMIIGAYIEQDKKINSYQTAIINGAFDADKLDYIKRDSLTVGLALEYDIERLLTKIAVHTLPTKDGRVEHRLVIRFNGVTAIEKLTFCKIMLFSYIYYHQKVLVSEIMIKDYVYGLCHLDIIKNFSDFLRYTDSEILSLASQQGKRNPFPEYPMLDLSVLAQNIKIRRLPKRCFEMSQSMIQWLDDRTEDGGIKEKYAEILDKCRASAEYGSVEIEKDISLISSAIMRESKFVLDELLKGLLELPYDEMLNKRKLFYDKLVEKYKEKQWDVTFTLFDVYLVFPLLVSYGSAKDKIVLNKDNCDLMTVNDFVKLDDWAGSFNSNKWRGYVFVTSKIDRTIAYYVAEEFIFAGKAKLKNPTAYIKGIED